MFKPIQNPKNRLIVGGLMIGSAAVTAIVVTATVESTISGLLAVVLGWAISAVVAVTGIIWMRGDRAVADTWFNAAGAGTGVGVVITLAMSARPFIAILIPFVILARVLARRIEEATDDAWRARQFQAPDFDPDQPRTDPLVEERERARQADYDNEHPSTLRELKAKLRRDEGDPWR